MDDVQIAGRREERVFADIPGIIGGIEAKAAVERVVVGAAGQKIAAVVAGELVVAAVAEQCVDAVAAGDDVVAVEAVDGILAIAARQSVVAVGPVGDVVGHVPLLMIYIAERMQLWREGARKRASGAPSNEGPHCTSYSISRTPTPITSDRVPKRTFAR